MLDHFAKDVSPVTNFLSSDVQRPRGKMSCLREKKIYFDFEAASFLVETARFRNIANLFDKVIILSFFAS